MMRVQDTVLEAMLAALRRGLSADNGMPKLFALLDGALLGKMPLDVRRRWPARRASSLLPSGAADTAVAVGPLLFEVQVDQLGRSLVESLVDMATGELIGSILVGSHNAAEVVENLRQFVDVRLDDGTEMVMRFYDPRILPFWLEGLPDEYARHLGAALSQWLYWGADWELRVSEFASAAPQATSSPTVAFPVRLSAEREAQLVDASVPHLMMSRLRSEDPDALSKLPHAVRYGFLRQQLDRAKAHGLNGMSDLETYCGLAVTLGPRFDADPAMEAALQHAKAGAAFHKAIAGLNAGDWQRVRKAAQ